ncbi:hypothetical protein BSL78_14396 [Apostichopus japonicus]|uniref:RING-type domain-containing protein n=1 Tax=Stichopus japonicus TaxID=307972 RepID=A0A2G8KL89_STIJA|nr:hypothetical protein BSL78_14396 [Apostichopus japonicus]
MEYLNTILNEIGENFLSCPICIQHLKEPKVLPCLHRYCSDCLESYIKQRQGELECSVCREFFTIPSEGFKTDYFMKNLIEYVTLEKPEINIDLHNCVRCDKHRTAVAYCFDRKGYLCENCYDISSSQGEEHLRQFLKLCWFERNYSRGADEE